MKYEAPSFVKVSVSPTEAISSYNCDYYIGNFNDMTSGDPNCQGVSHQSRFIDMPMNCWRDDNT